jgi:putative endopeptidase
VRSTYRILCASAAALALLALVPSSDYSQEAFTPQIHGVVIVNMDRSIKPGDDFYHFANGDWIKRTEIPADRSDIGAYYSMIDMSQMRIAGLIEEAARANAPFGSNTRKIADLYSSYMDEATIEAKGLAPLRPQLDAIAAIRDKHELARALGETLRADVDALDTTNFHTPNLFGLWVAPGFNDPEQYTAYLLQGGLELPDRKYYLYDSDSMRDIRAKYLLHVSALLKLAGFADAAIRAQHIVDLEHAIAVRHLPAVDRHDIHKANNTWKQANLVENAPGLDWAEYLRGAGLASQATFIVWQPAALTAESALVASTALDVWKDWLAFHVIEDYADVLPKGLADERFNFFDKTLYGASEQRPRRQRAVDVINGPYEGAYEITKFFPASRGVLGDAVGQLYAQRYFSPQTKTQIEAMVVNLIAAFRRRIDALSWMDPATKAVTRRLPDTFNGRC